MAHNTDLKFKLEIRQTAIRWLDGVKGAFFVPYCGFGECASFYDTSRVFACDIDRSAIEHWHKEFPDANVVEASAEKIEFPEDIFCYGDFDAYGNPWKSIKHFFSEANLAEQVAIVATDAAVVKVTRGKQPYNFSTGIFESMHSVNAEVQKENWQAYCLAAIRKLSNYPFVECAKWKDNVGIYRPAYGLFLLSKSPIVMPKEEVQHNEVQQVHARKDLRNMTGAEKEVVKLEVWKQHLSGKSVRAIMSLCNIGSEHTVIKYRNEMIERYVSETDGEIREMRSAQLMRTREVASALHGRILAGEESLAVVRAYNEALDREIKLLGLNSPTKVDVSIHERLTGKDLENKLIEEGD